MPSFNEIVGRLTSRKNSDLSPIEKPSRLPVWMRWRMLKSFNFILYHYIYLLLMSIVGSVLLFGPGRLSYIDALFFACGAVTQSGLNTVDLNNVFLYQQIVMIILACLCNPITINTFVVFVRLYWFEKRFQHIVRTSKSTLRARTRSRTKTQDQQTPDLDRLEKGVEGRSIRVFHDNTITKEDEENGVAPDARNSATAQLKPIESPTFRRDIVFADELVVGPNAVANTDRVPEQRPKDQHIAFVENQRNPKDNTALRIPGPRDFEAGYVPERIIRDDSEERVPPSRRESNPIAEVDSHEEKQSQVLEADAPEGSRTFRRRIGSNFSLRQRFHRTTSPMRDRAQRVQSFIGRTLSKNREDSDPMPYLSYAATIGRNSAFVDLTEEQREELGGIEYRSLKTLAAVLLIYNIGWTIFGIIILTPWIVRSQTYSQVVRNVSQAPAWWGIFTSMSMFTDLGFTITPDSMISFQRAALPLLLGSFLIIIGNTGFPIMLRFCIWVGSRLVPNGSGVWEEFRFLLDHPRRCFTLLFPSKATWWLLFILIILNGIDLIFFIILDLKDAAVTSLPGIFQFLDGLFQAAATRTAGFSCVNLADLHPGIQVSYLVMMYISVFPIAISVRRTNVYEEKSLGIYAPPEEENEEEKDEVTKSYIGSHLRRQLSFDLWYIFLGLFFICIIEGGRIENNNEPGFTIFSILFEIVSAYGTVGLSLGFPNTNASFSSQFKPLSKLIIITMMLRGRHRGLPYALDRAILLPGEGLKTDKIRRGSVSQANERAQAAAAQAAATSALEEARGRTNHRGDGKLVKIVRGALSAGPVSRKKAYRHN